MKNETLCLDVVRAGIPFYLNDNRLSDFTYKECKNPYFYKNITLENGAVVTAGYYCQFQYLFVKCSFPKVVYGDNRNLITKNDMSAVISAVNNALLTVGIYADFSLFSVSNIEVTYNYVCRTEAEKQAYIVAYNKHYVSRRNTCNYAESAVFKNRSTRTTIYDKAAEILYRNNDAVLSYADKRIVRVEHKIPKRVLDNYQKGCLVEDLINIDLRKVLKEENEKAGLAMITLNEKKFYKILEEKIKHKNTSTKLCIINFYKELNEHGEQYVKNKYSPYVFRSYRKIMLNAGYSTVHTSGKAKTTMDFQKVEKNSFVQFTKQEIRKIIDKIKGESKTIKNEKNSLMERMASTKLFCLLRKFFNSISESYFNTS